MEWLISRTRGIMINSFNYKQKTRGLMLMKKLATCLSWALVFAVLMSVPAAGKESLVACGDDQVLIIDSGASEGEKVNIVWSWKVSDAADLPEVYQQYMQSNDDCKPVDGNSKILITSSSGGVVLVDRDTKKSLFYAHVPNAHSAEYLPGNRIVVALSTAEKGNRLELYDAGKPDNVLFSDDLHSGHGAVWVSKLETLFALGGSELRAYSLENRESEKPGLKRMKTWSLPGEGGHDLAYVSDNLLLLTTEDGVWNFDIKEEKFSPFSMLEGVRNVKSVNFAIDSGRLVFTKAEESWWTENIYLRNPDKVITLPGLKLYKVRVMDE